MSRTQALVLLAVALLAATGGALTFRYFDRQPPAMQGISGQVPMPADGQSLEGQRRPDYTLGSVTGERVSASDFDGQVVLLNFWATWCAPCREEMPMLVDLHDALQPQGFEVVGIALDDVQQAREFVTELGVDYTVLVGATDVMAVARVYGNRSGALPYSVLLDRQGVVRWTYMGVLEAAELKQRISELLDS